MADTTLEQMKAAHRVLATLDYPPGEVERGYAGRTLHVDLGENRIEIRPVTQYMKDIFTGGKGFDLYLMWQSVPGPIAWDDPRNGIYFSAGPLAGTPYFSGSGKCLVTGISPVTGSVMDCNVGGHFGPLLKFAGFDALEVRGKAPEWTLLVIDGDAHQVRIETAPHEALDSYDAASQFHRMYARDASEKGVEAAAAGLNRARAKKGDASFFGVDETMQQATQYLGSKQYAEAIGLLRACREDYPQIASTYAMLAQAYLGVGDIAAAEKILKESEKVEAMIPLELPQIERAKTAVRKQRLGSAADTLGMSLAEGGIPAADAALRDLLARRGKDGPVFEEADFNNLGYRLLQENKVEAAIYVFEKTVELYPDSWNAYDSLGEVLAKAGRKERAIEGYRKSLELNPGNKNGQAALKLLEEGK